MSRERLISSDVIVTHFADLLDRADTHWDSNPRYAAQVHTIVGDAIAALDHMIVDKYTGAGPHEIEMQVKAARLRRRLDPPKENDNGF